MYLAIDWWVYLSLWFCKERISRLLFPFFHSLHLYPLFLLLMCDYSLFLFLFKSKLKLGLPFGFDFSVLFFCRCLLGLLLRLTFIACHSSFPVMKESFIFLISSFLLNRSTNSTLLWAGYVSILFLNPGEDRLSLYVIGFCDSCP